MTPESARYLVAVAKIGLEADDGLETLRTALENQTALAADGIYAIKPLLTLMAESPEPPRDAAEALARVENVHIGVNQPDPPELPPMAEHTRVWLHGALTHPIKRIRQQAIEYLGWRLEDAERVHGLAEFVQRLIVIAQSDPDADIRRLAIQTLANPAPGELNVTDELIKCLHDPIPRVRWAAQTSLEKLSQPDSTPPGMVILATTTNPREESTIPSGQFLRRSASPLDSGLFDVFSNDDDLDLSDTTLG
jgi:HEAT repeat protein